MTNQKILEKALLKAHQNGWNPLSTIDWVNVEIEKWDGNGMVGIALLYNHKQSAVHWVRELEGIIFNQDFTKALWGKWPIYTHNGYERFEPGEQLSEVHGDAIKDKDFVTGSLSYENWQYHLQQMVIADDPIKYLGENIIDLPEPNLGQKIRKGL